MHSIRLMYICLALSAFAVCAEDEPVKVTEVKLKDGSTVRALKFSSMTINGTRSYTLVTVENKRLGLQEKEVISHKEVTVPFADLPEVARTEISKQRAAAIAKAEAVAAKPAAPKAPAAGALPPVFQARVDSAAAGQDDRVVRALKWLADNQEADGRWSSSKHAAGYQQDTAVTGLALMAFLATGQSEKQGDYKEHIRKGLAWLKSKQSADGLVYDTSDNNAVHRKIGYPHAIAMTALCEAAGMGGAPDTKQAAQKAVEYAVLKQQSNKGGWRYAAGMDGCLSVSGWYIAGLKAAKAAGLRVPPEGFARAGEFLESVSHNIEGAKTRIFWYMPQNEHPHTAHRLTMIGYSSLANLGRADVSDEESVKWATSKGGLPRSGANGESTDLYYWYYGAQAAHHAGGEVYENWLKAVNEALANTQTLDGSFHPVGDYSGEWGRVGQTALAILCLETPKRYPRLEKK
jgi:hypothetical protein